MAKRRSPRKGSMQYWPRKRASKATPRIRSWNSQITNKPLAFCGYKVGMTHIMFTDASNATTKGMTVSMPVTVIECPPLKTLSLRFYQKNQIVSEILNKKVDKELERKITKTKKSKEEVPKEFDNIKLVVYTQPKLTGIGKKKPEIFEIQLNSTNVEEAKKYFDKEIKLADVLKEGQFLDAHAVTKGKGFQGVIKRFGLALKSHKSEKKIRAAGNLGAWHPARVLFTVPQAGQMGYHLRTDYNKLNVKIGNKPEEINPKGGFLHYGLVKNDYALIKGSIPGSTKRLIVLTHSIRNKKDTQPINITKVSLRSKQ